MFVLKKKYYLIVESIKDINLKKIKKRNKFVIIYRNLTNLEKIIDLQRFRKNCKLKSIDFFVANDLKLANKLCSDGIYLSSYNSSLKPLSQKKKFKIIGSAHTSKEIFMKIRQGCEVILLSKLFLVNYDKKAPFLGVIKFNNYLKKNKNLVPLGGISLNNLNNLNMIGSNGLAIMSEIKKKPANIINRLF
jgi:thiamine-phosphate pyrophosphorylase